MGNSSPVEADAVPVDSYRELVEEVANLSFLNKDYLLFFRGQTQDHRNKAGKSTIYPSIYRGERVSRDQVRLSFEVLKDAASRLCSVLEECGVHHQDVSRRECIQWSILQHYEVCPTPLLDLTQSLRVACSFAMAVEGDSTVLVFGLPYVTNRVSRNSEHDLVNIRLLSICPPEALRPHFQEGYLAGSDEVTTNYENKSELDFNNRLIAKYRLEGGDDFWRGGFGALPESVLYPTDDRMDEICRQVRTELDNGPTTGRIGAFLRAWGEYERHVLDMARAIERGARIYSSKEAEDVLRLLELLPPEDLQQSRALRQLKNRVVHEPERASPDDVLGGTKELRRLHTSLGTVGYCVKCKAKQNMQNEEKLTLKNGKPATRGVCPTCGTKMFKIAG